VTRPRAADDFATIRARLLELHGERDQAPGTEAQAQSQGSRQLSDTERRLKDRREGAPPPWVPTIFFDVEAQDKR
jgi:hypothetical protein